MTIGGPPLYHSEWNININDRVADPVAALEILTRLPLLRDSAFARQFNFKDLTLTFARSLMQVTS